MKVVRRHGTPVSSGKQEGQTPSGPFAIQTARHAPTDSLEVLAIAASTGGPAALKLILSALPRSFPLPILVVQHIARGFAEGLAHWLNGDSQLHVKIAELSEPAEAGTVYIAPDDRHLGVRRDKAVAQVDLVCGPHRIVSLMPREVVDRLALRPGDAATAVVRPSAIVVERE